MRIATNAVVLYLAWFGAVLSAAANRPWHAAAASVVALAINIALARHRAADAALAMAAALVGLAVDGILIALGIATYAAPGPVAGFPPAWIVLMWMVFATMLNAGLAWLKPRLVLAAVFGLVGGPLSYYAGARLGAMQFNQPLWPSLAAIAVLWAIALPFLLSLASRAALPAPPPRASA